LGFAPRVVAVSCSVERSCSIPHLLDMAFLWLNLRHSSAKRRPPTADSPRPARRLLMDSASCGERPGEDGEREAEDQEIERGEARPRPPCQKVMGAAAAGECGLLFTCEEEGRGKEGTARRMRVIHALWSLFLPVSRVRAGRRKCVGCRGGMGTWNSSPPVLAPMRLPSSLKENTLSSSLCAWLASAPTTLSTSLPAEAKGKKKFLTVSQRTRGSGLIPLSTPTHALLRAAAPSTAMTRESAPHLEGRGDAGKTPPCHTKADGGKFWTVFALI
jgi:hypothetical protein